MTTPLRTLHLFAGAGGGIYADLILGHTPVGAVEIDAYCCALLRERAAEGWFPGLTVHEADIRRWDPSEYAGRVDCIHAGFPCTDISVAGRGAGIEGKSSGLWSEVVRVADAVRPRFIFIENSPAIVNRGLVVVLSDLAALGFDARWCVLGAAAVGAPHLRARFWCLATRPDASSKRRQGQRLPDGRRKRSADLDRSSTDAADPTRERQQVTRANVSAAGRPEAANHDRPDADALRGQRPAGSGHQIREAGEWPQPTDPPRLGLAPGLLEQEGHRGPATEGPPQGGWWESEPDVVRVVHGMANRVDRIKALGNGQVPLQAACAWRLLRGP